MKIINKNNIKEGEEKYIKEIEILKKLVNYLFYYENLIHQINNIYVLLNFLFCYII